MGVVDALKFLIGILWQAIKLSVSWMGTSLLAIAVTIIIIPIVVFSLQIRRVGWKTWWKQKKESLTEAAIATVIIWILLIAFNCLYTIPHGIDDDAKKIRTPPTTLPIPPPFAYVRSPRSAVTGRHLSASQRYELTKSLSKYPGQKFAIDCAVNDVEAHAFALEIRDTLIEAKWQMISYVPAWDMEFSSAVNWQNFFGVQWFEFEGSPHMPAAPALREELKACCGINAQGVNWSPAINNLETDAIYVWVGADNRKPIH